MFEGSNMNSNRQAAPLTPPLENCLESLLTLSNHGGAPRARDLAQRLAVHKSTITATLRALARRGLVDYRAYERARLTPRGRLAARRVTRRHQGLRRFFADVLRLSPSAADCAACRVEHVLDAAVVRRIEQLTLRLASTRRKSRTEAPAR
jgi:DtxR family Mn-dependent transcriptional regulator